MVRVPLRLQPTANYNFHNPNEWPSGEGALSMQFRVASGSGRASESEEQQISTFVAYVLSGEADDLASASISNDDKKEHNQVLGKMDEFFKV